jgi:hypothetical protein
MMWMDFLQLLLLSVIGICLIFQTVTFHSTTHTFRQTLDNLNGLLPRTEQLLKEASRTLGEAGELFHRANRVTHGLFSFFAGRFGNGARHAPRRGIMKR